MDFPLHLRRLVIGAALAVTFGPWNADGGQEFASAPDTNRPVSAAGFNVYGGIGDGTFVDTVPVGLGASFYSGFRGELSHRRRGPTHDFSVAVGTSYRYFPDSRELLNLDGVGAVTLSSPVGQHGRLRLSQSAQYTRFRQFSIAPIDPEADPGSLPIANPEESATVGQPFYDLTSSVNLAQSFGQRSSLQADYSYRINLNDQWNERPDTHEARLRYQHAVGRRGSGWLGTSYRLAQTGLDAEVPTIRANDFEGGIAYMRRGTTFNVSSGVTLVSRGNQVTADVETGRFDYQLVGAAGVSQKLGRSWTVRADYRRLLQFVDAFPDPFAADQADGSLTGALGRRASVSARVSYWTGIATATTAGEDQRADGWQASSRLDIALARRVQAYGQYSYTANYFSDGALASLPGGIVPRSNWGGVQVGLVIWVPYVH